MRISPVGALLAALLTATAVPVLAHHEVGGYDTDHPVRLHGVVREFIWANPHVMLYVSVPNASAGQQEWALEGESVPVLARNGWTRKSLRPGEGIDVVLAPKRDAKLSGHILSVTGSDGRSLTAGQPR